MIVIECDQLFDGTKLVGPNRITIDGDRVTGVMPKNGTGSGAGDDIVRAPFVMPGLVDAHVHIAGYREGSPMGAPFEPEKHFVRLCTVAGVTTVRDLGNSVELIAYIREWAAKFGGPRVFSSGPVLDCPPLAWPFSRMARTEEEVHHIVKQLAGEGLQWIKVYRGVEPDIFRTIVESAREHDLPVAIHCGRTTAGQASDAGARSIEHMSHTLDDLRPPGSSEEFPVNGSAYAISWSHIDPDGSAASAFIDRLATNETWVCPTLLVSRRWALIEEMVNEPKLDYAALVMPYHRELKRMQHPMGMKMGKRYLARYMPVSALDRGARKQAEAGLEHMAALAIRLHREGVRVAIGTDAPNPSLVPGFSLHDELAAFQVAGLAPVDALKLATSAGGELLGRDDIGVVRVGAAADLLCLDGDPSRDVHDLGTLRRVMTRGTWSDLEHMHAKLEQALSEV